MKLIASIDVLRPSPPVVLTCTAEARAMRAATQPGYVSIWPTKPAHSEAALRRVCDDTLTSDYWTIGVPTGLAKASARSPTMFAHFAALNLLDAQVLYSSMKTSELMDPAMLGHRSALERHHLFPKKYLEGVNIKETRETNQIANFALVEWKDNAKIAVSAPKEYVPEYEANFKPDVLSRMYYWHGLPDKWQDLPYETFLQQRRERMSTVIADGYKKLASGENAKPPGPSKPLQVDEIVAGGESTDREFKSTLRMNLHTGQADTRLEMSVLKGTSKNSLVF